MKQLCASGACVIVVTAASALLAQQPRDNRPRIADGTAVLAGRVLTRDTGATPLRKAIVTLARTDGRLQRTAIADDGGAFVFDGVPAGRYTLEASRRGWPTVTYGARRPHQPGTRIDVADRQRVDDLVIRMPRGAVLTGSLLDATGYPAAHTPVVALRFAYVDGSRRLVRYREDQTDDKGTFRIYGLAAGEYLVASAGAPMAFEGLGPIHANGEVDVRRVLDTEVRKRPDIFAPPVMVGYAPTYYPGTPFRAQAMPVTVAAGEERRGLDFEIASAQALTLHGFVDRPRGFTARDVIVTLRAVADEAHFVWDDRRAVAKADGAFTFPNVQPGTYELMARFPQNDATLFWASSAVTLAGDHAPRILLSLRPALTLSGRVAFDAESMPDASAVRIALQPWPHGERAVAAVEPSGDFVIDGLVPGRYRVLASVATGREGRGWAVKSFVVNGRDVAEAILDLRSSAGAAVTFTDRYATLSGLVLDRAARAAPDCFVVVFPADPRRWVPLSRGIQAVRPSSDGRYLVERLVPGEYFLAVLDDVEEGEWFERALLQRLAATALRIEVSEGQDAVRDLRVE